MRWSFIPVFSLSAVFIFDVTALPFVDHLKSYLKRSNRRTSETGDLRTADFKKNSGTHCKAALNSCVLPEMPADRDAGVCSGILRYLEEMRSS